MFAKKRSRLKRQDKMPSVEVSGPRTSRGLRLALLSVVLFSVSSGESIVTAADSAPTAARRPRCTDIYKWDNRRPSLWPLAIGASSAQLLADYQRPRTGGLNPVFIDGRVYTVDKDHDRRGLRISVPAANGFVPAANVALRRSTWEAIRDGSVQGQAETAGILAVAFVWRGSVKVVLVRTRDWKESSLAQFSVAEDRLAGRAELAGHGATFGIAVTTDDGFAWAVLDTRGRLVQRPSHFGSSTYISPFVLWADTHYIVLGGRHGDFDSYSFGVWIFQPGENAKYVPIIDRPNDGVGLGHPTYRIDGVPLMSGQLLSVAATRRSPDGWRSLLLHFDPRAGLEVEECGSSD